MSSNNYDVIVIGGGVAGLAAIESLSKNGITNILLIEAKNRLGGRINTIPFQDSFIEIGAQWIHGTDDNPIYDLNLKIDNINKSSKEPENMFYATQDGKVIKEKLVEKIIDEIHEKIDDLEDKIKKENKSSLGELFDQILSKLIDEYDDEIDAELIKAIFKSETSSERHESSCDDLNDLSANGWNDYEKFKGNQFTKLKHGYIKFVEYLRSKLSRESIRLNELVENINYSSKDLVSLTTYNSASKTRSTYTGRKCLCTLPLGYLKKNYRQLFSPPLSKDKSNAIENIGFGVVDKIFVVFNESFKMPDFQGVQIFWRDDMNTKLESCKKWNLNNNEFFKEFTNFELHPNHSNVLFSFVAGEGAIFIEDLAEECLIDVIHEILTKSFPTYSLARPKQIIRSKWHQDPFTLGSYSYISVRTNSDDMESLTEPLKNKVFFAGEGTIPEYIATVHGAFISGQRAAKLIQDSIKDGSSSSVSASSGSSSSEED